MTDHDLKSIVDKRRDEIRSLLRPYDDPITCVRRLYFDRQSYALVGKHDVEFDIKQKIADRYEIPFRSVIFTGSAQLGFSPHKDTEFDQGSSDLDIACVDARLYHDIWSVITRVTRAFSDNTKFYSRLHFESLQSNILRRGMILLDYLPKCPERSEEKAFYDALTIEHRKHFGRISSAVYISEHAFCWKQRSVIGNLMGNSDAE